MRERWAGQDRNREVDQLTSRLAVAELELVAKGYSQEQAQMATRYATRWARSLCRKLPEPMQARALSQLVEDGLRAAPDYLDGCARAAAQREHRRGMERAVRDGQFQHGIESYGGGEKATREWLESVPEQQASWERRFAKA